MEPDRLRIVAGIPYWQDGDRCLDTCVEALRPWVDEIILEDGWIVGVPHHGLPVGARWWPSQADKFNSILAKARLLGADWLLKVDADEILCNGDKLRRWLDGWRDDAFPLPVFYHGERSGITPVTHACKLIRVDAWSHYLHCNVLQHRDGHAAQVIGAPITLDPKLYGLPYLDHRPELRQGVRAEIRLSEIEAQIEDMPAEVEQWHRLYA